MKQRFHFGVLAAPTIGMRFHEKHDDGNGGALSPDFKNQLLTGLKDIQTSNAENKKQLTDLDAAFKLVADENEKIIKANLDIQKKFLEFQKTRTNSHTPAPGLKVSEECARQLGALFILDAAQGNKFRSASERETAHGLFKDIMGVECKAALTSSDIPLPVGYSGEVVKLVYQYGTARRLGTVIPLGGSSFKLPKLTTDTTFTLLAQSTAITQKSPQVAWVTFTPEKFGGLVLMPSEIEEDSIVMMGNFLADYAARNFARVEDTNFWAGTGGASGVNGTAEGLTKSVVTDSMFYYNGNSSTSGKTKGSEATLADFRGMRATPNGAVLQNAKYYMHPTYESLLVTFNTSSTVTPYIANGANGPTLDGFPIEWIPSLPALSTSTAASVVTVLFGDASFNYLGVRRAPEFKTSLEAGFATDDIYVRCLERFTIGKMATDCVAGLRNAAS